MQCRSEYDDCHNTEQFRWSGQAIFHSKRHSSAKLAIEAAIDSWWAHHEETTVNDINGFGEEWVSLIHSPVLRFSNFIHTGTQIFWKWLKIAQIALVVLDLITDVNMLSYATIRLETLKEHLCIKMDQQVLAALLAQIPTIPTCAALVRLLILVHKF